MPSTSAQQAKFMTACAKGWDAESCPPMAVARKFHEADKKEGKFICKDGCENKKKEGVALDDAGVAVPPPLGPMARLKLVRSLAGVKADIASSGTGPMAALKRLRLVATANQIRAQLGAGAVPPPAEPKTEEVESPHVVTLRAVAAGKHDSEGLAALFGRIQEAVNALNEAGLLIDAAEAVAQEAITHWAELEVRLNGDA